MISIASSNNSTDRPSRTPGRVPMFAFGLRSRARAASQGVACGPGSQFATLAGGQKRCARAHASEGSGHRP